MTGIHTPTSSLFTLSFTHNTDFTELADNCECFAGALIQCHEPAQKMALCGRLSACLALLQPTLYDPIPEALKEGLTVSELPAHFPAFEPEILQLTEYCQVLAHLLMSGSLAAEVERVITDLLFELVEFFAGTLKAPRWLKTDQETILLESFH